MEVIQNDDAVTGVQTRLCGDASLPPLIIWQIRLTDGHTVETRTSPPWFTEEEILQSVEGAEEAQ